MLWRPVQRWTELPVQNHLSRITSEMQWKTNDKVQASHKPESKLLQRAEAACKRHGYKIYLSLTEKESVCIGNSHCKPVHILSQSALPFSHRNIFGLKKCSLFGKAVLCHCKHLLHILLPVGISLLQEPKITGCARIAAVQNTCRGQPPYFLATLGHWGSHGTTLELRDSLSMNIYIYI